MSENNSEQKEKPLAGISLKMACGSKMALKISRPTRKTGGMGDYRRCSQVFLFSLMFSCSNVVDQVVKPRFTTMQSAVPFQPLCYPALRVRSSSALYWCWNVP